MGTCKHPKQVKQSGPNKERTGGNTHEAAGEVADEDLEEARPPLLLLLLHGGYPQIDLPLSRSLCFLRRKEATEYRVSAAGVVGSYDDELDLGLSSIVAAACTAMSKPETSPSLLPSVWLGSC